jgi:hypothetical protein
VTELLYDSLRRDEQLWRAGHLSLWRASVEEASQRNAWLLKGALPCQFFHDSFAAVPRLLAERLSALRCESTACVRITSSFAAQGVMEQLFCVVINNKSLATSFLVSVGSTVEHER